MPRTKLIENEEKMYSLFTQYKKWVDNNPIKIEDYVGKDAERVLRQKPRAYTMEGFENFVANIDGMPLSLADYLTNRNGDYGAYSNVCSRIKREIRQNQIEGGMAGIFNPSITQRLNGLTEKQELSTKSDVTISFLE